MKTKPGRHGTDTGYRSGCRKDSPCPARPTCHEAHNTAARERRARKQQVGPGYIPPPPPRAVPRPPSPDPPRHTLRAPVFPAPRPLQLPARRAGRAVQPRRAPGPARNSGNRLAADGADLSGRERKLAVIARRSKAASLAKRRGMADPASLRRQLEYVPPDREATPQTLADAQRDMWMEIFGREWARFTAGDMRAALRVAETLTAVGVPLPDQLKLIIAFYFPDAIRLLRLAPMGAARAGMPNPLDADRPGYVPQVCGRRGSATFRRGG